MESSDNSSLNLDNSWSGIFRRCDDTPDNKRTSDDIYQGAASVFGSIFFITGAVYFIVTSSELSAILIASGLGLIFSLVALFFIVGLITGKKTDRMLFQGILFNSKEGYFGESCFNLNQKIGYGDNFDEIDVFSSSGNELCNLFEISGCKVLFYIVNCTSEPHFRILGIKLVSEEEKINNQKENIITQISQLYVLTNSTLHRIHIIDEKSSSDLDTKAFEIQSTNIFTKLLTLASVESSLDKKINNPKDIFNNYISSLIYERGDEFIIPKHYFINYNEVLNFSYPLLQHVGQPKGLNDLSDLCFAVCPKCENELNAQGISYGASMAYMEKTSRKTKFIYTGGKGTSCPFCNCENVIFTILDMTMQEQKSLLEDSNFKKVIKNQKLIEKSILS